MELLFGRGSGWAGHVSYRLKGKLFSAEDKWTFSGYV